jgi:hypothetical protein
LLISIPIVARCHRNSYDSLSVCPPTFAAAPRCRCHCLFGAAR